MTPERWQSVKEVFERAVELSTIAREAYLDVACELDREVRHEVESLLAADDKADDFLERPIASFDVDRLRHTPSGPEPGDTIDHFKIMRRLGCGGMGDVYLARDIKLGRKVALKMISPHLLISKKAAARFMAEARTTAKFNHPNIVAIYGVGEYQGSPYVALEYLEGQDLAERMAERQPSTPEALRFGLAIAEALGEAHRHHVLHRDLKPANVVIPTDGRLRVVDFGLAKMASPSPLPVADEAHGPNQRQHQKGQTGQSFLSGTPNYMPPEQWAGRECTAKTDIWSLGVLLFEMTTGQLPFDRAELSDLAEEICGESPAPTIDPLGEAPPELSDLIARCLDKDPQRRPSATEVAVALRDMLVTGRRGLLSSEGPFRGLLPFTERHAGLFFGREAEVAAFVERLRVQPVLAVVGPSGTGKSSFVQAGVIPRLKEQQPWVVIRIRPGARPFETLAGRLHHRDSIMVHSVSAPHHLSHQEADGHITIDEGDAASLAEQLQRSPGRLSLELRAIAEEQGVGLLLFVDQIEELFTLVDDEQLRRRFLAALCTAADDPLDPVRVIFAARDDFLGRLAMGPEAREALTQVTVLQRPDKAMLERAVRRPVETCGYHWDDPTLVDDMVAAVHDEPASLPLLQFAAQMLWEKANQDDGTMRRSAYEQMGGVEGAIAKHADGVLDGFSPAELWLAHELLLRLVTPERTRRAMSRSETLEGLPVEAQQVLTRLINARLVTVTRSRVANGEPTLELTHESLIHHWSTLASWIDENQGELTFVTEIRQAAELWKKRGCRPDELWTGDALREALCMAQRCSSRVPDNVRAFIAAASMRNTQKTRRRRFLVFAAMLALTAVALVLALQKGEADFQRDQAERGRIEADRQRAITAQQRAEALREAARAALAQRNTLEARAKLRLAMEIGDSQAARALWWQLHRDPLWWHKRLGEKAYGVAFSPDGQTIAVGSGDNAIHLLDVKTKTERILRGHQNQVLTVAFSPVDGLLASGGGDRSVRLWNHQTGRPLVVLNGHQGGIYGLAFSPDGRQLATASYDRTVRLWDVASGAQQRVLLGHEALVWAVRYSPDGRVLASGSLDRSVRLWDVTSGTPKRVLRDRRNPRGGVRGVAFSPDGRQLAAASDDQRLRVYNLQTGQIEHVLWQGYTEGIAPVSYSADGQWLASAGQDQEVRIWDPRTGDLEKRLRGHRGAIWSLQFSPDSRRLVTGSTDRSVRLWTLEVGQLNPVHASPTGPITRVAFSPDGRVVAAASNDRTVRLFAPRSGRPLMALRGHSDEVKALAFSPDGQLIASAGRDRTIRLWELPTGRQRRVLSGHTKPIWSVDFSPDSRSLASSSLDRTVRLWDVASGNVKRVLTGHRAGVTGVSFGPRGQRLASTGSDRVVRLWDVATGRQRRLLQGHQGAVYGASFSHDGKLIATGGTDKTLRLWDFDQGSRVLATVPGLLGRPSFHPDGRRIGAPASDGLARIWNLSTLDVLPLRGHRDEVNSLAFSPDGRLAATGSDDATIRLFDTDTGRPHWRAPVLLRGPPRLFTHQGWRELSSPRDSTDEDSTRATNHGGGGASLWAYGPRARQRLERHSRQGAQATGPDGTAILCIIADDGVELWDLVTDNRRLRHTQKKGFEQLVAIGTGCVARSATATWLLNRQDGRTQRLVTDGRPTALGANDDHGSNDRDASCEILLAAGEHVHVFDCQGRRLTRYEVGIGVSAVARTGPYLSVGYRDGSIELYPTSPSRPKPSFAFEAVPASAPARILNGPRGTVIVGYANGFIGLWNLTDGLLLAQGRLHGPVIHLLVENQRLYAATELGEDLTWDLSPLYRDYCPLLRELWREVDVIWQRGHAVTRPPPSAHRCSS